MGVRRLLVIVKEIVKLVLKLDRVDYNVRGIDMNNVGFFKVGRCSGMFFFFVVIDIKM